MIYLKLFRLEIKQFFRSPQFSKNLVMKILTVFGMFYIAFILISLSIALFYGAKAAGNSPLTLFSRFFIYFWAVDLIVRYFIQQMPTQNVKPFLSLNISKLTLVKYTIFKTFTSFFNWIYLLFLLPFALLCLINGFSAINLIEWLLGVIAILWFNNFLNIILNGKTSVVISTAIVVVGLAAAEYFKIFSLLNFSENIFEKLYSVHGAFLVPVALAFALSYVAYRLIYNTFYLDEGLQTKKAVGKTQNLGFLNRYGAIGTFLNNDIRLILRNKYAKQMLYFSVFFIFYGFFFSRYLQNEQYFSMVFAGIFITGGFQILFGQRIPAWDSSYYQLIMTQNISYKNYLKSKWWLMVIATAASAVICVFYGFIFTWKMYWIILGMTVYNIGVNSFLVLLQGVFNKSYIDLNSKMKTFGERNSFNMYSWILGLVMLGLPLIIFFVVKLLVSDIFAIFTLAILGTFGFLLREKLFDAIVKLYKKEKYSTIAAFRRTE